VAFLIHCPAVFNPLERLLDASQGRFGVGVSEIQLGETLLGNGDIT